MLPKTRFQLTVYAILALVVAGGIALAAAAGAGQASDPERDAAVALAFEVARDRGSLTPGVVSVERADAAQLRGRTEVPMHVRGSVWLVTLSGSFDIGMRPPGGPYADPAAGRGIFSRLEVLIQNGRVVGGNAYK